MQASSLTGESGRISTVGITTADRPQLLDRCLRSLIRQADAHHKSTRIVVVDASKNSRNETRSRSAVSSICRATGRDITFVGRSERQSIGRALNQIIDQHLVDLLIRPGASGNRNLIILLSRGQNVLLLDDDVVCEVWRPRSFRNDFGLCGHIEEREIAFYKTRTAVCDRMVPATVDLLEVHETTIGRQLSALNEIRPLTTTATVCDHMRQAARGRRAARVRMTFAGIAGDAGVNYPDRFLFSTGRWAGMLKRSADAIDTALKYREICKIANRYLLMHEVSCMAACMGLSNRWLVPPFLPVGRNEDGLFGAMLSAIDPTAVSCHVPYAVLHNSSRPPRYVGSKFPSAKETRTADLMIALVHLWLRSASGVQPRPRLVRLGEWLRDLASVENEAFVDLITVAVLTTRERELARIKTMVEPASEWPTYWQRALRAYRRELLKNLARPDFPQPVEFRASNRARGWREFQQFVRSSADLLIAWPTVWQAAPQVLRQAGASFDVDRRYERTRAQPQLIIE